MACEGCAGAALQRGSSGGNSFSSRCGGPCDSQSPRWRQRRGQSCAWLCVGNEAPRIHTNWTFLLQAKFGYLLEIKAAPIPPIRQITHEEAGVANVVGKVFPTVLTCGWHYVVHENVIAKSSKVLIAAWNKHLWTSTVKIRRHGVEPCSFWNIWFH